MNVSYKTAIERKTLSKPTQILLDSGLLDNYAKENRILDYGCGRGGDVTRLKKMGYNISGYDKYIKPYNNRAKTINGKKGKYDIVICNYVFNVIDDEHEFKQTIREVRRLGKDVYISVRADKKSVKDSWTYDSVRKGYWTTTGTFQRFFDEPLVYKMFEPYGNINWIKNNSQFKMFKLEKRERGSYNE